MGSTNHADIPVANKFTTNDASLRKDSRKIKSTAANDDTVTTVVTDSTIRAIGSGSIVSDGTATFYEEKVVGMILPGRQVDERIASTVDASRSLSVDLADNTTLAVIPSGLEPHTPQEHTANLGNNVVRRNSVGDTLIDRI